MGWSDKVIFVLVAAATGFAVIVAGLAIRCWWIHGAILLLAVGCSDELLPECLDKPIPGQWAAVGETRDAVVAFTGKDPKGDMRIRWCEGQKIPTTCYAGWFVDCQEILITTNAGLSGVRHEAMHCYRQRIHGADQHDPQHRDCQWWALIGERCQ